MASIAGLDVPYGASLQLVQTGILVCNHNTGQTVNLQAANNALTHFNQVMAQAAGGSGGLRADYLYISDHTVAGEDASDLVIDSGTATTALPVSVNHPVLDIISVLEVSAFRFGDASFTTPEKTTVSTVVDSWLGQANQELTVLKAAGNVTTLDLSDCFTDLEAHITADADLQASGEFGTAYVAKGNAAGDTSTTTISSGAPADSFGFVKVLSLCRVA
tara:strand:+ start:118 stop:771 length:654 start_codon:yes stop_codon:yes gene_type:complete